MDLVNLQVDSYESVESATSQVSPTKDDSFDEGTRSYLLPAPPLISAFQDLAQQAGRHRLVHDRQFPFAVVPMTDTILKSPHSKVSQAAHDVAPTELSVAARYIQNDLSHEGYRHLLAVSESSAPESSSTAQRGIYMNPSPSAVPLC